MYATVFVLTVITDFWANWYSYAIVHDWIITQAFLGLALPFLNLPGVLFFIDQKDMKSWYRCRQGHDSVKVGDLVSRKNSPRRYVGLVVRLFELDAPHFGGLLPVAELMTRDGLRVWKVRKLRVMNESHEGQKVTT
jgi:hypothetical protein